MRLTKKSFWTDLMNAIRRYELIHITDAQIFIKLTIIDKNWNLTPVGNILFRK